MDLLFRSERFNLSRVGKHFINPCCFGEDLATLLRDELREKSVEAGEPYQEDWGWELPVYRGNDAYYLGATGNAVGGKANPDEGEWRVMVTKKRSLLQRLTGKGKIARDDQVLAFVREILSAEAGIRDVQLADGAR